MVNAGLNGLFDRFLGLYRIKPEGVYYVRRYYFTVMDLWILFAAVLFVILSLRFISPDDLLKSTAALYMLMMSPIVFVLYNFRLR